MIQKTYDNLDALKITKNRHMLVVRDRFFSFYDLDLSGILTKFDVFLVNTRYKDVKKAVKILRENNCDFIVAIGGGSCIDTAKVIKYYNRIDIPFVAIPTTSGTGSETTHFAVIYRNEKKNSLADIRLLPNYVILEPMFLKTLPLYQKKCGLLDSLAQSIESWWSIRTTTLSMNYNQKAIKLIMDNIDDDFNNNDEENRNMLLAADFSGKAINLTTTTATHSLSYQLTTLYDTPHGHAVALCLPKFWAYMKNYNSIANVLGQSDYKSAIDYLETLLMKWKILPPKNANIDDLDQFVASIIIQRLNNNLQTLNQMVIRGIYKKILEV